MTMTKEQQRYILDIVLLFTAMIFLTNSISAITGSMGNAKMVLYPEVNGWTNTKIERSVLVRNINDETINVSLELDTAGKEFIELIDKEFSLAPNEEKKANFIVKVKKEGTYEGKINVFFSPTVSEGPGVVLSSSIIVIAKKDQEYQEVDGEDNESIVDNENSITGAVTGANENNTSGIKILGIGSVVLLVILLALLLVAYKKQNIKPNKK